MFKFFITPKNCHAVYEKLHPYIVNGSSEKLYNPLTKNFDVMMPVIMIECERVAEVWVSLFPEKKFDLYKLPDGSHFLYTEKDGVIDGPVSDRWEFDPSLAETEFFPSEHEALQEALKFVENKDAEKKLLEYIKDIDSGMFFCARKSNKTFLDEDWRVRKIKKYPVNESERKPVKVY